MPSARREGCGGTGRALALVAVLVALGGGCRGEAPTSSPEGAVRALMEHLERYDGDPGAATAAFELLSASARDNLEARAKRYSAASGKHIEPYMMLAPASYLRRFEPRELRAEIRGKYALVRVAGLLEGERAEIPCVFEEGAWRVDVKLPSLPPVETRPRDDAPAGR